MNHQPIEIKIKHRSEYGRDLMDVCDAQQAQAINMLTGCRTVTIQHVKALKLLGFNVIDLDQVLVEMFKRDTYKEPSPYEHTPARNGR